MVKANGPAKEDQSIYMGTYREVANYNGHIAYEKEGSDQLYIYYFSSVVSLYAKFISSMMIQKVTFTE